MDRENFDAIIKRYLEKFEDTNNGINREFFKWKAVDWFQNHWDLNAADMLKMFSTCVQEFSVLLDTAMAAPTSGIKELLKKPEEIETVRTAFRDLYADDGGDLSLRQTRLENFVDTINQRIWHYWPKSHLYAQSMRSAICYLTMLKPHENYILFWSRATNWANCVEFGEDIGSGSNFSLATYYRMCDELTAEIEKSEKLKACADKRTKAAGVTAADNYHMMTYDIIFCATAYNLYVDIPHYPKSTPARIQRAKERSELKKVQDDYFRAQADYEKCVQSQPPMIDLVGHTVQHKVFGSGTVLMHAGNTQTVKFKSGVKSFIYPDAYTKKFLIPASADDQATLAAALAYGETLSASENKLSAKEKAYNENNAAFEKKWAKSAKADPDESDG